MPHAAVCNPLHTVARSNEWERIWKDGENVTHANAIAERYRSCVQVISVRLKSAPKRCNYMETLNSGHHWDPSRLSCIEKCP